MTAHDDHLIDCLRARDLEAYRRVYDWLGAGLLRVALRILGNHADAEDAVQDTFLILYRRIDGFRGDAALTTWMHRVLVNVALKKLIKRSSTREETLRDPGREVASRDPAPHDRNASDHVAAAVDALPLQQRIVFVLAEVEGLSHAEIASVLHLQDATVRYHLCKAKQRLRQRLRPWIESR